jgi:hypothetical protein
MYGKFREEYLCVYESNSCLELQSYKNMYFREDR